MNILKTLRHFIDNESDDLLESSISSVDFISIGNELLQDNSDIQDIEDLLLITQYIETDTTLESIIPDEMYDSLYEKYKDITGKDITGTSISNTTNRPTKEHKYPEARGSLDKVHFVYDKEKPVNDSRKSLEYWFRNVLRQCEHLPLNYDKIPVFGDIKHDGLCAVFECTGNRIDHILTRRDTESNIGVDITHIVNGLYIEDVFTTIKIPEEVINHRKEYAIKTEVMVSTEEFNKMQEELTDPPKNRRSAASMILNTIRDEYDRTWLNHLTIQPLQLSLTWNMDKIHDGWVYIGKINDRDQFIKPSLGIVGYLGDNYNKLMNDLETTIIPRLKEDANDRELPTDGVVFTIADLNIVETVGRKDNRNKFQVAYKFPAGIAKTKLLDVDFQVGCITGTITPVAKVEPVKIMGNTIVSPGLSNCEKMEKLNLRVGDEVLIRYDIVPILYKDATCKSGTGDVFKTPKVCPVCGHDLYVKDVTVRCMNTLCETRRVGKIYNYVNKIGIENVGKSTVEELVDREYLDTIADLYRLQNYKSEIIKLSGWGELKFAKMIHSINKQLLYYPHQILGSIGIPDIGRRVMEKVCKVIPPTVLIYKICNEEPILDEILSINGIGEKMARKIYDGIKENKEVLDDLLRYVSFKEYELDADNKPIVLFSKVKRDGEFESYLEANGYKVATGYSKAITILVVPNLSETSTKIEKAKKDGKEIVDMDTFKKRTGYDK